MLRFVQFLFDPSFSLSHSFHFIFSHSTRFVVVVGCWRVSGEGDEEEIVDNEDGCSSVSLNFSRSLILIFIFRYSLRILIFISTFLQHSHTNITSLLELKHVPTCKLIFKSLMSMSCAPKYLDRSQITNNWRCFILPFFGWINF